MEECSMGTSIKNVTENYRERIQRLALFDPLYTLENKKSKDRSDRPIDYFSLGLLALLFFFENMLIRNKKTGVKELAYFFQELNNEEIDMNYDGFERIARVIIETFRPTTGKRNTKTFYNWETRKEEFVQYSILKADKADLDTNTQYYTLDEQGLELIFATKEYFTEFQLSINQLVLRKQLEKGEFVGALRQIDEMSLDVKNLQERMVKIKHEIQRNIISNETFERYKNIVEDVNIRLLREDEEFEELMSFVKETKEKIGNEITNEKDRKTYDYIVQIDRSLGEVHYEHRLLLKESVVLKTSALQAAQEALYYVGIDSFNFNQEITSRLFSSPILLNASRRLVEPFLQMEKHETWSPITVFLPQRLESGERVEKSDEFLEVSEEEIKMELKTQQKNFGKIMEIVLESMHGARETRLDNVINYMNENGYEAILGHRSFYDFWILMHQKSPVVINNSEDESDEYLLKEAIGLLKNKEKALHVEEREEILNPTERFTIKNMRLWLEGSKIDI